MTIENMNHLKLVPHKDYTANRLVSGLLQLPSSTSLVVDETLLEQGQLDTPGACVRGVSLPLLARESQIWSWLLKTVTATKDLRFRNVEGKGLPYEFKTRTYYKL